MMENRSRLKSEPRSIPTLTIGQMKMIQKMTLRRIRLSSEIAGEPRENSVPAAKSRRCFMKEQEISCSNSC